MTIFFVVPVQFVIVYCSEIFVSFVVLARLCTVVVHFVLEPGTPCAKELSFGIYM